MNYADYYSHCPYDGELLIQGSNIKEGRPSCPRCDFVDYHNPKPCVAILILAERRVLLARRGVEPAKGMWDIPGGFIDAGESAEEAVVREALEETGLQVRVTEFLGSLPDVYGDKNTPTLNFCFIAKIEGGELRPQSDVESLSWFATKELPRLMAFAHQPKMFERYQKRIQESCQPLMD